MPMVPTVRPAASLYATVRSSWAWAAAGSPRCVVPLTNPGGNPVTAVPGLSPRSPLTVVAPVLVTVEPARTENVVADPRTTGAWPAVVAAVVKLQARLLASALPAKSLAPVVIVASYTVLAARLLAGVKVAVVPTWVTVPTTGVNPWFSVKVAVLMDSGSIASLKVALMFWLSGTAVAAFAGTVRVTV